MSAGGSTGAGPTLKGIYEVGLAAFLKANRASSFDGNSTAISAEALRILEQITDSTADCLVLYIQLLVSWSAKMNLVGDSAPEVIVERHILDCAALFATLKSRNGFKGPILDIGSGAGLPGIVLAILAPEVTVALCEPREKRVQFLLEVKRRLNLKNVEVNQVRVEQLAAGKGNEFQIITARAVASPEALLNYGRGLLQPAGYAAFMVGPRAESTVESALLSEVIEYRLGDGRSRAVMIVSGT